MRSWARADTALLAAAVVTVPRPYFRLRASTAKSTLARIRALLTDHSEGCDLAVFLPPLAADAPDRPLQARAAVASTFLAGLELARDGQIRLEQAAAFGAVTLHPPQAREASDEAAT